MNTKVSETLRDQAFRQLRNDIIDGRLGSGERLSAVALSQEMGVSLGVVREALTSLASKGLVQASPRKGFRVAELSAEEFEHLTEVRCSVEGLALTMSIEKGDLDWETGVVTAFHRFVRVNEEVDWHDGKSVEWDEAHAAFHHSLINACPVASLVDYCMSIRDATSMYRSRSLMSHASYGRDTLGEHRALRDAALARDAELARKLLEDHYRLTYQLLEE